MASLAAIPDLLLHIILQSDLDTLLHLRLTSRSVKDLITAYESTVVRRVARNTFPQSKRLLLEASSKGKYDLKWLLDCKLRQLAAIAVDKHRWEHKLRVADGAAAEDPVGEELRERVFKGFRILRLFSNVARDAESVPLDELPQIAIAAQNDHSKPFHVVQRAVPHFRRKSLITSTAYCISKRWSQAQESTRLALLSSDMIREWRKELWILETRENFLRQMWPEYACYFQDMFFFVKASFSHLDKQDKHFDWGFEKGSKRLDDSWVSWYILREGPRLFWEQWWANRDNPEVPPILEEIEDAWDGRPPVLAKMERESCRRLFETLDDLAQDAYPYNPIATVFRPQPWTFFAEYGLAFERRLRAVERHPEEILERVAFHVDMKPFVPL
ncbi:hypothetical protein BU16DRAFT_162560 [Lophium mytilinum]|uniref:F-box domain-containing protein n=1 Tax=Lophium mytilinum TaxID=390894 RepID=A0A6A6QBM4_9PEZI|nr:hypothetical protein BU16DRAFT_162560 [Lophium mytilinum]